MDYFGGLDFVLAGETPSCQGGASKSFDGYFGIQYNHSGTVMLSIDHAAPLRLTGPHAFLTYPGPFFDYAPPAGEIRHHLYCCFRGPRVQSFLEHGLLKFSRDNPAVRITRPEQFLFSFHAVLSSLNRPDGWHSPRAVLQLEDLLLQMQEQPGLPDAERRFYPALVELAEAIRLHPELDWDMTREAVRVGISAPYLRKLFAEYFGLPPHRFLLDCRLRLAASLLVQGNDPVAEVALQAGFDDPYYFSRIFSKFKKISPSHYRARYGGL